MAATSGAGGSTSKAGGGSRSGSSGGSGGGKPAGGASGAGGSSANKAVLKPDNIPSTGTAQSTGQVTTPATAGAARALGTGTGRMGTTAPAGPSSQMALQAAAKGVAAGMGAPSTANATSPSAAAAGAGVASKAAQPQAAGPAPGASATGPAPAPGSMAASMPQSYAEAVQQAKERGPVPAARKKATAPVAAKNATAPVDVTKPSLNTLKNISISTRLEKGWTESQVKNATQTADRLGQALAPTVVKNFAQLKQQHNGTMTPKQDLYYRAKAVDLAMKGMNGTRHDVADLLNASRASPAYDRVLNGMTPAQQSQFQNKTLTAIEFFKPTGTNVSEVIDVLKNPTKGNQTRAANIQTAIDHASKGGFNDTQPIESVQDTVAAAFQLGLGAGRTLLAAGSQYAKHLGESAERLHQRALNDFRTELTRALGAAPTPAQFDAALVREANFMQGRYSTAARELGMKTEQVEQAAAFGDKLGDAMRDWGVSGFGALVSFATRVARLSQPSERSSFESTGQLAANLAADLGVMGESFLTSRRVGNALGRWAAVPAGVETMRVETMLRNAAGWLHRGTTSFTLTDGNPVAQWKKLAQNAGGVSNLIYGPVNVVSSVRQARQGNVANAAAFGLIGLGEMLHGGVQLGRAVNPGFARPYTPFVGATVRVGLAAGYGFLTVQRAMDKFEPKTELRRNVKAELAGGWRLADWRHAG